MNLDDQTSVVGEPLGVARHTGKSSWETLFTSSGSTEADDSDLIVSAVGLDETHWATRVTLLNKVKFY